MKIDLLAPRNYRTQDWPIRMVQILVVLAEHTQISHGELVKVVKAGASDLYELGIEGFIRHSPGGPIRLTNRFKEAASSIVGDYADVIRSFPARMPLAIFREIRAHAIEHGDKEMRISLFTKCLSHDPKTIRGYLETLVTKGWLKKEDRGGNFYWSLTPRGIAVLGTPVKSPTEERRQVKAKPSSRTPSKVIPHTNPRAAFIRPLRFQPRPTSGSVLASAPSRTANAPASSGARYIQPDLFAEVGASA